jgi:hypothetical protein
MIEVEPAHLGADGEVVHLLGNRPAGRIDRGEPTDETCQVLLLGGHCGSRVVGHTIDPPGLLEGAPLAEQRSEVVVAAARRRGRRVPERRDGHAQDAAAGHDSSESMHRQTILLPMSLRLAPMLSVRRGAAAVEFYKAAFGSRELFRIEAESGAVVVELEAGDARFWVADESPDHLNFSPESLEDRPARRSVRAPLGDRQTPARRRR